MTGAARLMTDGRKPVVAVLVGLLGVMVVLWFLRGPEPTWPNVRLFAISLLLVPLAYLAVYGFLYLTVRVNRVSAQALRWACGLLFGVAAFFLAGSTLIAIYDFATHRSLPAPNLLAFGVALGAMKAWGLQAMTTALP